ncbi:M48 family metallopeptidase [Nitrospira lenta]|uniref:Putative Peptidase M48 Ste24p n=1 Tax=Nitrospira lenta TaxID=1436998 RepID=A0A330L1I5_9BACT|nr:M48 family metallopeptidase [Nitrospira lenta]SPP63631.1 putative Peptidase M48 Ste24p [Nitrospira lenta]
MSDTQFEQLVRRLEAYASQHPAPYKRKIALTAALGYAYVLTSLGLALGVSAWLILSFVDGESSYLSSIQLLFGLGILATITLRAFRARATPPTGYEVYREDTPRLFLLIDKLTTALDTPPLHHVLIVNDLNAAVSQRPRLGIFGWYQNYLLLGLPLMLAMTPAQFRAVLAHELTHLSPHHGRFSRWVYRTRIAWSSWLKERHARDQWGSALFPKFLDWYAPFFNACSFALARAQEYEADRQAAGLVGPHAMKDALAARQVIARLMDELYWPALNRRTITNPTPPASHLDELITVLQRVTPQDSIQKWLHEAMQQTTNYADIHPALADRLAALDQLPEKPNAPEPPADFPHVRDPHEATAANYYLDAHATATRAALDRSWAESVAEEWQQKHEEMAAARARCQSLSDKSATVGLSINELWEYACQMEALESGRAALPLLQQLLAKVPAHAEANLAVGRLLLAQNDQAGLLYLEKALAADRKAVIPACQLASGYLERRGNHKESMRYRVKAQRQQQQLLDAEAERSTIKPGDSFEPHGLAAEVMAGIAEQLASKPGVQAAYLVRKKVQALTSIPCYALVVIPHRAWYELDADGSNQALQEKIRTTVTLPEDTSILIADQLMKHRWINTLKAVPQSAIRCTPTAAS